jgi:hypothetical protein
MTCGYSMCGKPDTGFPKNSCFTKYLERDVDPTTKLLRCRRQAMNAIPAMPLPPIPLVDVRVGGPLRHALDNAVKARALRDSCLGSLPRAAHPLVPSFDRISQRWLARSRSPYVHEIAAIADGLDISGVWLLNTSMQWGCTSRASADDGVPWLLRTLDWPFHGLGHHTELAQMSGAAGDFVSVTWPGYVGVLTAMAPGRFAAALNQAPMWRRTTHRWLRICDFALNARHVWAGDGRMPPDQLLRQVFETCMTYETARTALEQTPVSRAVIFTLVGCAPHERCVIERTEDAFITREDDTCAANDWVPSRPGWEGRIGTRRLLNCSFAEAARLSKARRDRLAQWSGSVAGGGFDWVSEPVLNPYTRLAVTMSPAHGVMRTVGYDMAGGTLPQPVTQIHELDLLPRAA